jgi:MerR family mercuric resistance operon transcriptional regulator/MerR family copper efflux transcriptional regulator
VKIGEIAGEAGVTVDTVRFYERVGVLPTPARTESGYRDYVPETVERIRLTRELQAIGFTLNEAVDALAAHDAGGATCESERWRLQAVLDRVDAKLAELTALRGRIVDAQAACDAGCCRFSSPARTQRSSPPSATRTGQNRSGRRRPSPPG